MINEEINKLVEKFVLSEKNHKWTNIPTKRNWIGSREKNLDTLARLVTGNETCVAVFLKKHQLLVASNEKKPEYSREYLKFLSDFIADNSEKNYFFLIEEAIKQSLLFVKKKSVVDANPLPKINFFKELIKNKLENLEKIKRKKRK